jgi:DNA-binding FadR family transcriptional regulator
VLASKWKNRLASTELAAAEAILLLMAHMQLKRGDHLPQDVDLAELIHMTPDEARLGLQFLERDKFVRVQRARYLCSRPAPQKPSGLGLDRAPTTFDLLELSDTVVRQLVSALDGNEAATVRSARRVQQMADSRELDLATELSLVVNDHNELSRALTRKLIRAVRVSLLGDALASLDHADVEALCIRLCSIADQLRAGDLCNAIGSASEYHKAVRSLLFLDGNIPREVLNGSDRLMSLTVHEPGAVVHPPV